MVELFVVAVALFGFALCSAASARSVITAPMIFTAVGLAVGGQGLGLFELELDGEGVTILVEATLVLVLFTDAVRIDLSALRRDAWLPARLLGVGLPLMLILGTIAALLIFPTFTWPEAALLAAVLAPTDAALGQPVVSDQRLPVRLRQGLNVESGLNDGIVVPVVAVLLALAAAEGGGADVWGPFVAKQIGFGLTVGLVCGLGAGWVLTRASARGWIDGVFRQLGVLAIAAAAYAGSELLGGNGFVAAFVAGLAFGRISRDQCHEIVDFTEDEGQLLTSATFLLFGALFAGSALAEVTWQAAAYAVVSLVVIRVVAVLIALFGSGALIETRFFAGWFGPRGLASILFALLVVDELEGPAAETIFVTATLAILISIAAHGITANPWTGRLAAKLSNTGTDQPEMLDAAEMPTRWGDGRGTHRPDRRSEE